MNSTPFINYLSLEKRYSAHTINAYKKDVEDFFNFCKEALNVQKIAEVSQKDIRLYLVYLSSQNMNPRSINRKLSSLKSYFKFLVRTKQIENSPAELISNIKTEKKIQIPYSRDEIQNLLDAEEFFEDSYEGVRDQLIIELFYQTGMRKAELIALKLENIQLENNQIKVLGKRNKERIIPISEKLHKKIQTYIKRAKDEDRPIQSAFFLTQNNKEMYPRLVYKIVNSYLSNVTNKVKKSPHMLRHSFATHMLQNGADINAVKELLGHSSLAATQVYTHNDIENLKKVFNRAHPRERLK